MMLVKKLPKSSEKTTGEALNENMLSETGEHGICLYWQKVGISVWCDEENTKKKKGTG